MGGTRFMVQWEEHPSHLATRLGQLLEHQTLVDVTLMCNTHTLRVHRAVLAACSPYFETILQRQLGMYPLIVLKDMQFSVLKSLIEFMYCGETSVTEDNLSALLQAAKFFQVKGLSAMTKEALGLTSTAAPKTTTTVNGEAARKAFVGRSKRVGMQQTFVASGLKSVTSTSGDGHATTTGKTIFQTTPKSVPVRQDTQTDTAQLLLSLSGSEFPKQTFHTVSKNVRFHHGASSGNVTVEPSRTCSLESSIVKNKELPVRAADIIDHVPVVTSDGSTKSTSIMLPAHLGEKGLDQQILTEKAIEGAKDDTASQMIFVEDGPCKRGRPLKRQMNLVFQEKVLTDAEMALQKEAEASRKALEMLQQEMSTGDEAVTQPAENAQQKVVPVKQPVTKTQPSQVNNTVTTTARILPKEPKLSNQKINTVAPENVIYQVAENAIDANSNETNIVYQLQEGQDSGSTNIVYQVADAGQDSTNQNIIYQVTDNAGTSAEANNTNIIYQVTDSNTGSGTTMSQYMEVLKEAGLPSDVPILLESSDGSYVTVNEEVLMNIMNGGMIQVSDGSIVGGEGVQFIVQEVQEVNEGQTENATVSTEESVAATSATECSNTVTETVSAPHEMQTSETEKAPATNSTVKHSTYKPAKGYQNKANAVKSLPTLEVNVTPSKTDVKTTTEEETLVTKSLPMEMNEPEPIPEPPTHSDEIITGDNYGEEAMEGFAIMETKEDAEKTKVELTEPVVYSEQSSSIETESVKESKAEDAPANGSMSVEQALQAMMGEGSDTEMEVCANTDANGTTKVKPVISHHDTKGHNTPNEGSIDEETEDLRLVLSPEDDSVKIEDESQSTGEGSLNDSFTLALSSPDSMGNEKNNLEADSIAESQQPEVKSAEAVNENEEKCTLQDILIYESNSADAISGKEISESVTGEVSNDAGSSDVRTIESIKQLTPAVEAASSPTSADDIHCENGETEMEGMLAAASVENTPHNVALPTEQEALTDEKSSDTIKSVTESSNSKPVSPESGEVEALATCDSDAENTSLSICTNVASENKSPFQEETKEIGSDVDSEFAQTEPGDAGSSSDAVTNESFKNASTEDETVTKEFVENEEMQIKEKSEDDPANSGEGGTVTSPSKDIPYAVGLLPLKTALEKLQAMPEYHPRKTRSASSSKESANEVPASRLKRKSSSTTEGSEKKLKSDDGDCSLENENNVLATAEELDECREGSQLSESSMKMESTISDEPMDTKENDKVEPLPSMMELVSDPSETV